jgi:murein DD-endopeptidase MepM/ murein hydrolase activator NlpD
MNRKKGFALLIGMGGLLIFLAFLGWYGTRLFEGDAPKVVVEPLPEYLSGPLAFKVRAEDAGRGLRSVKATLNQEGREIPIFEERFSFLGLFNRGGTYRFEREFSVNPSGLNLAQGRVDLAVQVWDHSRRRGGDGNLTIAQHKMMVDTLPPSVRAVSRMHYINVGGSGLVVYEVSSDTVESGVQVNELFFKGYRAGEGAEEGSMVCYFALPVTTEGQPTLRLRAKDRAGNESTAPISYQVKKKPFRTDKMQVTDRFLETILPYFSFYDLSSAATPVDKFLRINRDLRAEGDKTFYQLREGVPEERLWRGPWLRQKNSAPMAMFGDRRIYFYQGNEIDRQIHMGVDLASLANAPVEAVNRGRVRVADRLGIYGLAVILDHGQGLASVYAHLSKIGVSVGQEVQKGQEIGLTGMTGLAGGDHLHFGVLVGGIFADPVEWWDPHWIEDNVEKKLALLRR